MEMLRVFSVLIAILSLAACQEVVRPVDDNAISGIYYLSLANCYSHQNNPLQCDR